MMTEAQLRRYQALLKNALDGFHVMTIEGNIVEANDAFCEMLGYSQMEAQRLNICDWNAQWPKEELLNRLNGFIGKSGRFETVHRRKDGGLIHVEVSVTGVEIDGEHFFFTSSRNITARKLAEQRSNVLMQRHDALMTSTLEGIHVLDMDGSLMEANDTFCAMLGYTREEASRLNVADWDAQWSREELTQRIRENLQVKSTLFETKHRRKDGAVFDVEISATGAEVGGQQFLFCSSRDITERKRNEENLRIAAVTFDIQEAIVVTDRHATILRVNKAFQDVTGYTAAEVIGRNPRMLKSGHHDAAFYQAMWSALATTGKWSGEIIDRRKSGEIYPSFVTITAVHDGHGQLANYVCVVRDITQVKKTEQEIYELAFYDPLTRLPNRRLLLDRLQKAMAVSARTGHCGALLFLDMDNFKTINDTQGHATGDRFLVEVAQRLQQSLRDGDSVARLGGDEFVVMLEELNGHDGGAAAEAELVAEKIRSALAQPYILGNYEGQSSTSIGVSLFCGNGKNVDELFKQADVAMYQAKAAGRNTIRFFDPAMQTAIDQRAALEADLHQALKNGQFCLHYQLQADRRRRPLGAEVLVRWQHPERGLLPPAEFIPLAEENGLVVPIGLWVLEEACRTLSVWSAHAATRNLTLSVNISARQFHQADFVSQVRRALAATGAAPHRLKLELTESILLQDVEDSIAKMSEIKALGMSFSLDDFGTGHSSLSYLKRLPIDQIKIDQSFVRDIATDSNDAAIVQVIFAMAETLGLSAMAEGVECEEQRMFLELRGCHAFQGYLFGRPLPLAEFEQALGGASPAREPLASAARP